VTYTTYMVYDVQKCSLYGRLYDGFVRPWKWTLTDTWLPQGGLPCTHVVHKTLVVLIFF
jgi:hypothetical protein